MNKIFSRLGTVVCLALALNALFCASARAGYLLGSVTPVSSGSDVDLTTVGKLDWIHWGLYTPSSTDRKWGVAPQISDYQVLNGDFGGYAVIYQYADNANSYSWSDGAPNESVTNTTTGVWAYQTILNAMITGYGFQFTAPADPTERILQVYVGAYAARGKLQATLSDGSATNYVDTSLYNAGNGPGVVYSLRYKADSTNQTLTVSWTLDQRAQGSTAANVTLQAAALTATNADNPPFVTLTSPLNQSSFAAPASVMLSAAVQDFDGTVTNVAFYAGATKLGGQSTAPWSFAWNNVPAGRYWVTAVAADNEGATRASHPLEIFVYGTGGTLSAAVTNAPSTVDLTAEGTADWTHWGVSNGSSFDYKSTVPRQISNFTPVGTNSVFNYTDNLTAFSWSDGAPVPATNGTTTGVYVNGLANGFTLTAPADASPRTLRLYVGGYGSEANFEAYLSDFSAPLYADTSVSNVYGSDYLVYTLNYAAASPGQTLRVTYQIQNLFDYDYGNATLQSATLQGTIPTTAPPVTISNSVFNSGLFSFWFNSATSHTYDVEFTPSLDPVNWQTLTNLTGTGGELLFTDPNAVNGQRFYRVKVQ